MKIDFRSQVLNSTNRRRKTRKGKKISAPLSLFDKRALLSLSSPSASGVFSVSVSISISVLLSAEDFPLFFPPSVLLPVSVFFLPLPSSSLVVVDSNSFFLLLLLLFLFSWIFVDVSLSSL